MLALSFQKSQNINIVIYYSYNLLVLSSGAHEECLLLQKSCQSDAILYSQYFRDDFPMEDLHTCRTWEKFSKVIYNLNNANVKVFQAFRSWGQRTEMWAEKFFPPSDFVPQSFFWTAGAGHFIFKIDKWTMQVTNCGIHLVIDGEERSPQSYSPGCYCACSTHV